MNPGIIKCSITVLVLLVALAHLVWPSVAIDAITVTLILAAVLPWLSSLFKSIELPGGLKVEYREVEKIEERARKAGLLTEDPTKPIASYTFQTIASTDPNLALAGLRIELEKRLVKLAESRQMNVTRTGLNQLLVDLNRRELIRNDERSLLADLTGLLNSAVHGAAVDPSVLEWALSIGPEILKALDERAESTEVRYHGIVQPH